MLEFLVRLCICLAVVAAGFAMFISRSRSQHRDLWLLFPLLGSVPASLAAALLFVPIERLAQTWHADIWATPAVVLAGASIVFWFDLLARFLDRVRGAGKPTKPFRVDRTFLKTVSIWILLGALWGALWRVSAAVLGWIGLNG